MGDYLPRSAWNARPRRHHPGILEADEVDGLAFHWPGTSSTRPISKAAVPRALRSWQDYHMDGHGWSDIAYQVAVDQYGRKWTLRGLENRSAANGGWTVNGRFGAVLLVLVAGEEPSRAMIRSVREVVADHRALFPHSRRLEGHGAIRPGGWTECPGPAVRAAIDAGTFEPRTEREGFTVRKEDEETIRAIVRREIRDEVNRVEWGAIWRIEQLVRELVRRSGAAPVRVIRAARKSRRAA